MKSQNKMQKAAPLLVAAAAVLWGILVIFVRKLNAAGFEAMDIVGIRVYGSAFFLFVGIGLWERIMRGDSASQSLLRIRVQDSWCFVGTGVVSIVFFQLLLLPECRGIFCSTFFYINVYLSGVGDDFVCGVFS